MVITSGPGAEPYEALMARRRVIYLRRQAVEAAHARSQLVPRAGVEARRAVVAAATQFEHRLERARQRNAEALLDVGKARAWLQEYGPQAQHQKEIDDDGKEEEDGLGDYKNLARRALRREQAAFRALVEDEASLLSASFLRQLQLAAGRAPAHVHVDSGTVVAEVEEEEEGCSWLDRRQRRARENERIVRRLFEQQRKRRLGST